MLVFWDERLVLFSVPKTGSTALEGALSPHAALVFRNPPELKHAPCYRYRRFLRPYFKQAGGVETMDTVALVRHPVAWLSSWYRYRHRDALIGHPNSTRDVTFDAFVLEYCKGKPAAFANVGSQARFLTIDGGQIGIGHLFRYEAMDKAVAFFEDRLSQKITLNQRNVSPVLETPLSDDVATKLRQKCAAEFAIWEAGQA